MCKLGAVVYDQQHTSKHPFLCVLDTHPNPVESLSDSYGQSLEELCNTEDYYQNT